MLLPVGEGIAGLSIAKSLLIFQWRVQIYEEEPELGAAGA
jgi:uncharacterized protein with NAD-binding domain and iron-sulfur cluster